ncbi:MAG: hypothetical protein QM754_01170 [Tepidisphaeraceae bacterium]
MTYVASPEASIARSVVVSGEPGERVFAFRSSQLTRDVAERQANPFTETGSDLFDGLFALRSTKCGS